MLSRRDERRRHGEKRQADQVLLATVDSDVLPLMRSLSKVEPELHTIHGGVLVGDARPDRAAHVVTEREVADVGGHPRHDRLLGEGGGGHERGQQHHGEHGDHGEQERGAADDDELGRLDEHAERAAYVAQLGQQAQGGFMRVGQSKAKIYMEKEVKVGAKAKGKFSLFGRK